MVDRKFSIIRRAVLTNSFAFGATLLVHAKVANSSEKIIPSDQRVFLSAASDSNDKHWLSGFSLLDENVSQKYKLALPARAHHIAIQKAKKIFMVVARRPGNYLLLGDLTTGKIFQKITVPSHRHLLGHGVFSSNGERFYAPESDFDDVQGDSGRVIEWQVAAKKEGYLLSRGKDLFSYGVGPHELLLLKDQTTLVVANGGIRTHPGSGREKLNLETMQPSLVYLNINSGELIEQKKFPVALHKASIRHLDINSDGVVALAMQYEGEAFNSVPLVATHKLGEELSYLKIPGEEQRKMQQYVGSIKFDNTGRFLAASCPRGNLITFWDAKEGRFLSSIRSRDGCGLSAFEHGFIITAGSGRIFFYDLVADDMQVYSDLIDGQNDSRKLFWDNHLS